MSRLSYEQYGERARVLADPQQASARLVMLREATRRVVPYLWRTLDLQPNDRVLDVGCGVGELTVPLSFLVAEIVGVDHPKVIARLRRDYPAARVTTVEGNWLDVEVAGPFPKIIINDCLQYLSDMDEVVRFVQKAIELLPSRGLCLLGDLPNHQVHLRTISSPYGASLDDAWRVAFERERGGEMAALRPHPSIVEDDPKKVTLDDDSILGLVRALRHAGYQAWVLPQDEALPFGFRREDVLVRRP